MRTTRHSVIFLVLLVILVLATVTFWFVSNGISKPIESSTKLAKRVADGNFDVEIEIRQKDEIGDLLGSMKELVQSLRSKAEITEQISQGNLSLGSRMQQEMGDKLQKDMLGQSILTMVQNLNGSFGQVKNSTFSVSEIAASSKEQNVGIDEINHALDQVNEVTQQNSASSEETAAIAKELTHEANQLKQMLEKFQLAEDTQSKATAETQIAEVQPYELNPNDVRREKPKLSTDNARKTVYLDDQDYRK